MSTAVVVEREKEEEREREREIEIDVYVYTVMFSVGIEYYVYIKKGGRYVMYTTTVLPAYLHVSYIYIYIYILQYYIDRVLLACVQKEEGNIHIVQYSTVLSVQ